MIEATKRLAMKLMIILYSLIVGEKPGPEGVKFMRNLSLVFSGIIVAKLISLVLQIYSGRVLGRVEYGKFSIITSIAAFFIVPMILGLGTAMVKYLAEKKSEKERKSIITSGIILISILTIASAAIIFVLSPQIGILAETTENYITAAIAFALVHVVWIFTQKIYEGLENMKKLSLTNIVLYAVALTFAVVSYMFSQSALMFILSFIAGYVASSLLVLPELRRYITLSLDTVWFRRLMKYGIVIVGGTICFTINENINKLLLNIFLTLGDVGLYHAYNFSTTSLMAIFLTGFITVFFPESAGYKDKRHIFKNMRRALKVVPLIFISLFAASLVILTLYGSEYPIMIPMVLLFTLGAVINFVFHSYTWFSTSISISGVKITTVSVFIVSIINITTGYIWIPIFGIYGAVSSTVVAYTGGLIYAYLNLRRLLK